MRDVAVVAFAQVPNEAATMKTPVEMIVPIISQVLDSVGAQRKDIDFWCHGSCDYMTGQPFSFVAAVDALGAWPPIVESHVEMDGAWALYEAWIKIQTGECDTALVFGNGKSSAGDMNRAMALQLDPYTVAPLWPDQRSIEGLAVRMCLEQGIFSERDMAEVVARARKNTMRNPYALVSGEHTADELLSAPKFADPFREHDCPTMADGVTAVIIAASGAAEKWCDRPAWIKAIEHRIDSQNLGNRSLTSSASATAAARAAGVSNDKVDVAELHAPFSHHELILTKALGLDPAKTQITPSGGALVANPLMAAGLTRLGEAATRIHNGTADRVVGHATQGPCLQQNLVCVMEASA